MYTKLFCTKFLQDDSSHSILFAVCYVGSQTARNFVTSLRGSTVSSRLEQFVLQLDNLYSSQTTCLKLRRLVSRSDSLSQNWTACLRKSDSLFESQTVCLQLRQCVPKVTICFKVINRMGQAHTLYWTLFKFAVWQYSQSKG